MTPPDIRPAPPTLTARQQEVAQLVAEGLSNRKIAARLGISRRTAEHHIAHIALKLPGVGGNRVRIARWVMERAMHGDPAFYPLAA